MEKQTLVPCPFCGGVGQLEDHRTIWAVRCACGVCMLGDRAPEPEEEMPDDYWEGYKQTAVAAWNRRAVIAANAPAVPDAQAQSCVSAVKYVPVASTLRDGNWNHPNDTEHRTDACRKALNARGDDEGQGLDGYWKWGFAAGFNAALAASPQPQPVQPSEPNGINRERIDKHAIRARDCPGHSWVVLRSSLHRMFDEVEQAKPEQAAQQWMPIETAPTGATGYAWMMLAWGPEQDQSTGVGMRDGEKFYASATFYCLGCDKQYEFREIEVRPTHWMPLPAAPQPKD